MVARFGRVGVQPAHRDQAEPEVADFGQQPVQRGLVGEQATDDRFIFLAADLEAVEPGGPPGVQDSRHTDLIPGRPACRLHFLHVWTVGTDTGAGRHPKVASEWDLAMAWPWRQRGSAEFLSGLA
jgi:hypothetical protein